MPALALKGLATKLGRIGLGRIAAAGALALAFGLAGPSQVAGRQSDVRRVALVITNNAAGADVAPGGDAVVSKLRALGYDVVPALNAGQIEVGRAIGRVEDRITGDTVVVVYYAGYAARANGEDWAVMAGITPGSAADLPRDALPLRQTVRAFRDKGAVVAVFIDGCRQSRMLDTLGGVCAGDPSGRERDVYLVSSAFRLTPGDLTGQIPGLLVEGRSVGQVFQAVQSRFGTTAVVEMPASASAKAAFALAPAAKAPPAPAQPAAPVVAATPPPVPAPSLPADGVSLPDFMSDIIELADSAEVEKARRKAAEFQPRYGALVATLEERDRLQVNAQIAYVNGDYAAAARDFQASRGFGKLTTSSEARLNRLQGTAYLRIGRVSEAVAMLEQADRDYRAVDRVTALGPVWTRLGEAYRLLGRNIEAREALEKAVKAESGGGKGIAYLQRGLLNYAENNWMAAEIDGNTAMAILKGPPGLSGLADAYVLIGRARFKQRPANEGEAWRYLDLARETDRQSAAVTAFTAELPTRLVNPPFETMRPTFTFARDIERRALTCYATPEERAAYLQTVFNEVTSLNGYVERINSYITSLTTRLTEYERRGYLEDYEGVLQGRGYRFRQAILDEQTGWRTRQQAVTGRSTALTGWHAYVASAAVLPCVTPPTQLQPPASYQPRLPPRDDYVATVAPTPSGPTPTPIAPQPAAPRPADAVPLSTAAVSPPPQPVAAPPPAPKPIVTASPPPPQLVVTPPPKPESPPPQALAAAATQPIAAPPPVTRPAASPLPPPVSSPPVVEKPAPPPAVAKVEPRPEPVAPAPKPTPPPAPKPEPKPAPPAVTTLAAAPPPKPTTTTPASAAPPPSQVQPPVPAPAPAASAFVAPPTIIFASTAVLPAPPAAAPAPTGKGKAPPPPSKPTGAAAAKIALERASVLLAQGKYDLAQKEYAAAAEAEPSNTEAQAGLLAARGLARLQSGQFALATDDLTASRAIKPIPEALEALGRFYSVNGNRGAAIEYFAEAIKLRPGYAQAYFGRAEAQRERATPLRDEAELRLALEDYKAALAVKGDVPEALLGLGMTRFTLGDYAGAVESGDAALKARLIFPEAKYLRARSRFELGQSQEALKDLVDLPSSFDVYARACSTGMAFSALGDIALVAKDEPRAMELYGQAADAFKQALAAKPADAKAKFLSTTSAENAMAGIIGKGSRLKQLAVIRLAASRKGVSPTATLSYQDACKRA